MNLNKNSLCCVAAYVSDKRYLGATVGRVANRIAQGHFVVEGKDYQLDVNNGPNALHGGIHGFNKVSICLWMINLALRKFIETMYNLCGKIPLAFPLRTFRHKGVSPPRCLLIRQIFLDPHHLLQLHNKGNNCR